MLDFPSLWPARLPVGGRRGQAGRPSSSVGARSIPSTRPS